MQRTSEEKIELFERIPIRQAASHSSIPLYACCLMVRCSLCWELMQEHLDMQRIIFSGP